MKINFLFILTTLLLCLLRGSISAQQADSAITTANNQWSVAGGYGTQQFSLRGDVRYKGFKPPAPFMQGDYRIYFDAGSFRYDFDSPILIFNGTVYVSDTRLISMGIGFSPEGYYKRFSFAPFAGVRLYHVRFTDADLRDDIATHGLQRFVIEDWQHIDKGPVIENGYANKLTFDIGARAGFRIGKGVSIGLLLGVSPVQFDDKTTLFGKYAVERPKFNDFYVQIASFRREFYLRFHF